MLKKILKVATTFTLLLGCYFAYVRAFDLVVRQFQSVRLDDGELFPIRNARSKEEAQALARAQFGPDHWTVTNDRPFAYYNSQKRFWMYWRDYEEIQEENGVRYDGKRVRMRPFAMIGKAGDGKSTWRLIAEEAVLDLNQPLGLSNKQSSDGIKVEHAIIERDVRIRDDRGTPTVPADDQNIGPMTYLEYDDAKRTITSTSHVVMQDPDQTTIGDGLVIKLRSPDPNLVVAQNSSSSGFGGAEYAILQANVSVTLRDVGSSGILPGGGAKPAVARKPVGTSPTKEIAVTATTGNQPSAKDGKPTTVEEPVPLFVRSVGPMTVNFPPETLPVAVGPPAPPDPTLVRFERNVVALHGHVDRDPNQLDCDTLRLALIPATPPPPEGKRKAAAVENDAPVEKAAPVEKVADGGEGSTATQAAGGQSKGGLFGNLTLQKAHATGHVVWLQLRKQSAKVRCSEMIHERGMPYRPDSTFFRGDKSRLVWLEKIDYEQDEEPDPRSVADAGLPPPSDRPANQPRKVKSVTHVVTISAKLFDRGNGLELVDVRAFGPGTLETRPDIDKPVERIAKWQDELTIVNLVGPDGALQQKRVTLTGTRPYFVDLPKKASLDSAQEIRIFLKPRTSPPEGTGSAVAVQGGTDGPAATRVAARPPDGAAAGDAFATGAASASPSAGARADDGANSGLGASLQIDRILAYRDVHFKAPNRYMEARTWLDAPFIEVDPMPAAASTAEPSKEGSATSEGPPAPGSEEATPKADASKPPADVAAKDAEPATPAEPAMTAVADGIWAKVAIPRGQSLDPSKDRRRRKPRNKVLDPPPPIAATEAPRVASGSPSSPTAEPKDAEAEIREAWLRGNVAVHQDKAPDPDKKDKAKPKGDDICGEAVYLDNKGKGKVNARVYHRDPTNPAPVPGPIRWAKVSTDDMITFGQTLWMDQEHDKIWAYGPGTVLQWTDRALMTDKTPEAQPATDRAGASDTAMAARSPDAQPKAAAPPKPKTRAGMPVGDKDLITITWTKRMEFTGRTKDTTGLPAGRADFFGIVDAKMTDATLHCEQRMIVYTDREVPLGEIGSSMGERSKGTAGRDEPELPEGDENAGREAPERSRVDIALIYCYGKPTAISRKVDPDQPFVVEQERIDAWLEGARSTRERLAYNRRTGEFYVPVPGMVFLFNRPDESGQTNGSGTAKGARTGATDPARGGQRQPNGRTVTPTSARSADRGSRTPQAVKPAPLPAGRKSRPPLVLMQVKSNWMIGRVGVGQASDTNQERWSEFHGNIEFVRSQVADDALRVTDDRPQQILNPDRRLSEDGFYLTSQMLRIIQEPPAPGSLAKTPARNWAKAFDRVHVNRGEAFAIESDVATFDSGSDLLWAYGENGHGVSLAHQSSNGQPPSTSTARAVQYNVKTHAWREVEGSNLMIVDHRTGARPQVMGVPDPTAPPPPRVKTPYKVPNTNLERRGFTGF